jgi:CheY-like chemotaxis protein
MKPLITPWRQRIYTREKDPVSLSYMSFESAVDVSVALNYDRVITGKEKKDIREQIEQAVEKLDIEALLDPNMPHLGGMEVLARIKQDLSRNLHSMTPVKAA